MSLLVMGLGISLTSPLMGKARTNRRPRDFLLAFGSALATVVASCVTWK
jgi:hypothetical protein